MTLRDPQKVTVTPKIFQALYLPIAVQYRHMDIIDAL